MMSKIPKRMEDSSCGNMVVEIDLLEVILDKLANQLQRELADRWDHPREEATRENTRKQVKNMDRAEGISCALEILNECFGTDYQTQIDKISKYYCKPLKEA